MSGRPSDHVAVLRAVLDDFFSDDVTGKFALERDAIIAAIAALAPVTPAPSERNAAGLASKEALIMKLSEGQTGDAGEAIQLAALFERFAIDHEPYGWPAIQQHRLSRAAALLRAQAATVAELRAEVEKWRAKAKRDHDWITDLLASTIDALAGAAAEGGA